MNKKILSLLGVASVAVGMTTGATSARASALAPGVLSVETDGGIFFSNNAVDFTIFNTATQSGGTAGTGTVTTPVNGIIDSGIFGVVPGAPNTYLTVPYIDEVIEKLTIGGTVSDPDKRRFPGSQGNPDPNVPDFVSDIRIEDFEINLGGDPVLNNIVYTLPEAIPYLHFDTDGDDAFGDGTYGDFSAIVPDDLRLDENNMPTFDPVDTDDFTYYITTFERRVVPGEQPGVFNVIFDFDGFFRDGAGQFKDTPSEFSLFNGVTGVDPETLPITSGFDPDNAFQFQAGGDGRVGTLEVSRDVPEPGTIIGLTALAGFGLASRLKRKAK